MATVMRSYRYIAIDSAGKRLKGTMEATNRIMCTRFLENKNMQVLNVVEFKNIFTILSGVTIGKTLKPGVLVFYLKQLGSLLTSGIKLSEALEILAMQQENNAIRRILFAVQQEVFNGNKLSRAFELFPLDFPPLLASMTEAGEISGDLGNTIVNTAEHFESQERFNRQIKSAIMGPVAYMIGAIVVAIGLMIFVFPGIESMFNDVSDASKMPAITRFFLTLSDFFREFYIIIFSSLFAFITTFILLKKFSLTFRKLLSKIILRTPFIGQLVQMGNQIMIANTLSQLMNKSVNTLLALEVVKKVTKNYIYEDLIQQTIDNIQDGKRFSVAFEESWAIDPIMSRMIGTGEKTSEIPRMLMNLSHFYNEISDIKIAKLRAAIQPILLVFVYGLVGALLLAIIIPQISIATDL